MLHEYRPGEQPSLTQESLAPSRLGQLFNACASLAERVGLDPFTCESVQEKNLLGSINGLALASLGIKPMLELPGQCSPHADLIAERFDLQAVSLRLGLSAGIERLHVINDTAVLNLIDTQDVFVGLSGYSAVSVCRHVTENSESTQLRHQQYGFLMGFPEVAIRRFSVVNHGTNSPSWFAIVQELGLPLEQTSSQLFDQSVPEADRLQTFSRLAQAVGRTKGIDIDATLGRFREALSKRCYGAGCFIWSDVPDSRPSLEVEAFAQKTLASIGFPYSIPSRTLGLSNSNFVNPSA